MLARQYNSCELEAKARTANVLANHVFQAENIPTRIAAIEEDLQATEDPFVIHHKKRKLEHWKDKLLDLQTKISDKDATCVFGSKKLWLAQFNLEANGYKSPQAWRKDWRAARNYNFQMTGCHDETMGNGMCQLIRGRARTWNLQLRLPLDYTDEYLIIEGLSFNHDSEAAYQNIQQVYLQNLHADTRNAVAYRFHKDSKGWIVTINIYLTPVEIVASFREGAIGVDTNHDHLSYAEIDHSGNILPHGVVGVGDIPLNLSGDADYDQNAIQQAAKKLVDFALLAKKGLVIEKLDFKKKIAQLAKMHGPAYAKMLSSFSYSAITTAILSRAYRMGVEVKKVNPAFTSVIGLFKYRDRYGLTTHQAAAYIIGRRCFHLSERLPRSESAYALRISRYQVTLKKPVDSSKHVWNRWGNVLGQMQRQLRGLRRKFRLEQAKLRCKLQPKPTLVLRIYPVDASRTSSKEVPVDFAGSTGDGNSNTQRRKRRPSKKQPACDSGEAVSPQVMRSSERNTEDEVVVPF